MQKGQCIIKRLAVGFTFSNLLAKQDKSSGKIKELGMNSVSENSIFFFQWESPASRKEKDMKKVMFLIKDFFIDPSFSCQYFLQIT